jgi:bifunctional non-homologous end joining protein LigD
VATARRTVEVHGRTLSLSNPDKVLWPATGTTKGELVDYYEAIGPTIVPWLEHRATTLVRCPEGVDGERFFEKMCPKHRPDWVPTVDIYAAGAKRTVRFCRLDEPAAVVWTAQLAAIELHPALARDDDLGRPTHLVVDLDPGEPAGLLAAAQVAVLARDRLARAGLASMAKVSGGKGVQVLAPLGQPCGYEQLRDAALALANGLVEDAPDLVVTSIKRAIRPGKVLVDWSQNSPMKTTVATWSARARLKPWVSVPVSWDELEAAIAADDEGRVRFELAAALGRAEQGDPMLELFRATDAALPAPEALGPHDAPDEG